MQKGEFVPKEIPETVELCARLIPMFENAGIKVIRVGLHSGGGVEEGFAGGKVSIGHCQNEEGAEQLKTLIIAKHPQASVEIHKLKGLCSFYAEMGGILVGFEKA